MVNKPRYFSNTYLLAFVIGFSPRAFNIEGWLAIAMLVTFVGLLVWDNRRYVRDLNEYRRWQEKNDVPSWVTFKDGRK